jgi:putative MATE family efflux protein
MSAEPAAIKGDVTGGGIWRHIVTMSLPVMLGMGLQNLYTVVDLFWVGRLGTGAVAAITIAGTLFFFFFSLGQAIGTGSLAIVSRAFGRRNFEHAAHTVRNTLFAGAAVGMVFGCASFFFAEPIIKALGGRGEVVSLGAAYLRPYAFGFAFQIVSLVLGFALRGSGDMKAPTYSMMIATVINIVLDPLMIYGWGPMPAMGVAGAGLATMISTMFSAAYVVIVISSGKSNLRVPLSTDFKPDWSLIKEVFKIGAPSGAQFMLLSFSFMVLIWIVADKGAGPVAAAGIGWRLLHISLVPVIGIGTAVATLVGQNLGVEKVTRATSSVKKGVLASVLCAGVISVMFASFPDFLIGFFSTSSEVISHGRTVMRAMAFNGVALGVVIVLNSAFGGAGDNVPSMIGASVRSVFSVGLAFLLPAVTPFGLSAVWASIPIASFANMLILLYIYRKGAWKTRMKRREEKYCASGSAVAGPCPLPPPD